VDRLAEDCGVDVGRREAQSLTAVTEMEGFRVMLAKPQTFMNLSGLAVSRLLEKYQVRLEDLMVLVDEVNLPLGSLRIRPRGSAAGHNGMKSIIGALGTDEFVRVRLGAQPEQPPEDRTSYVLGRFRKADLAAVAEMVEQSAGAARMILKEGVQKAMNRFNRRIPPAQS
jgi:PTH1 family peptidyl-tRNA hydrolase